MDQGARFPNLFTCERAGMPGGSTDEQRPLRDRNRAAALSTRSSAHCMEAPSRASTGSRHLIYGIQLSARILQPPACGVYPKAPRALLSCRQLRPASPTVHSRWGSQDILLLAQSSQDSSYLRPAPSGVTDNPISTPIHMYVHRCKENTCLVRCSGFRRLVILIPNRIVHWLILPLEI